MYSVWITLDLQQDESQVRPLVVEIKNEMGISWLQRGFTKHHLLQNTISNKPWVLDLKLLDGSILIIDVGNSFLEGKKTLQFSLMFSRTVIHYSLHLVIFWNLIFDV